MTCRIIKDKTTGEEFLIPGCYSLINSTQSEGQSDRDFIKENCTCSPYQEKYETKTRDEVFAMIDKLKREVESLQDALDKTKETLSDLKEEVMMLNTVELVDIPSPNPSKKKKE